MVVGISKINRVRPEGLWVYGVGAYVSTDIWK